MAAFHILWTIVLFAVFIGIVWWAWSGQRTQRFEEAARLPLEEDTAPGAAARAPAEKEHG